MNVNGTGQLSVSDLTSGLKDYLFPAEEKELFSVYFVNAIKDAFKYTNQANQDGFILLDQLSTLFWYLAQYIEVIKVFAFAIEYIAAIFN
jgi:hypothetical protein